MDFDAPPIIASTGRGHIGPLAGQLTMDGFRFKRHFSFLDYLRGGLELQLMVAVDLTRSNLGQTNPKSMPRGTNVPMFLSCCWWNMVELPHHCPNQG
jgi:hypothetical protein